MDRSMAGVKASLEHRGPRRAGDVEERALRARNQATEVARAAATGRASNPSSRQRLGRAFDAGDRQAADALSRGIGVYSRVPVAARLSDPPLFPLHVMHDRCDHMPSHRLSRVEDRSFNECMTPA